MWDDSGYELNDSKHPTFHERYADMANTERKRRKEERPFAGGLAEFVGTNVTPENCAYCMAGRGCPLHDEDFGSDSVEGHP